MAETDYMAEILRRLVLRRIALPERIKGYTEEEIEAVQAFFPYPLPLAFRQFLKAMGHGAGRFFEGIDLFFTPERYRRFDIARNNDSDESFVLPDDAFMFSCTQGCSFSYFLVGQGLDDPPVYYYVEFDKQPTATGKTFTEYLMPSVEASPTEAQKAELYKDHYLSLRMYGENFGMSIDEE